MKNWNHQITTPQLELRTLLRNDAKSLQQLLEKNKSHMLPWIPWAKDEPQTIEQKENCIREWTAEFNFDTKYVYGAFDHHDDLVGLGFLFTRQGPGILEIGYIIDHERSGRNYATELTYTLTKLTFHLESFDKVEIHCSPANIASMRIPEKLGFQKEGVRRLVGKDEQSNRIGSMIWGIFKEEFKEIKKFEPIEFIASHNI